MLKRLFIFNQVHLKAILYFSTWDLLNWMFFLKCTLLNESENRSMTIAERKLFQKQLDNGGENRSLGNV